MDEPITISNYRCPAPPRGCGTYLPVEAFPRYPADDRCAACLEKATEAIIEDRIRQRNRLKMEYILQNLRRNTTGIVSLTEMATGVIQELGGPQKFFQMFGQQIKELVESKPGTEQAVRALQAVSKLVVLANVHEITKTSHERMTDEELHLEIERHQDLLAQKELDMHRDLLKESQEIVPDADK